MYKLYPFVTNDDSMGLYNPAEDDIYHSVQGAATEAYGKFIFPADIENFFKNHNSIRVLDICYGIGYNTKSFLNFILQNKLKNFSKNLSMQAEILSPYNDQIYSDNINQQMYNDTIDTNNINDKKSQQACSSKNTKNNEDIENNLKIYIKAIDTDKLLSYLSPFIKSRIDGNSVYQFTNDKIIRFSKFHSKNENNTNKNILKNNKNCNIPQKPILSKLYTDYPLAINLFLLVQLLNQYPEIKFDKDFIDLLATPKYKGYFSKEILHLFNFNRMLNDENIINKNLGAFLHNIYYRNISRRYKSGTEAFNSLDIKFDLKINDARLELKEDSSKYDFVFLDAFTPSKVPCLWSLDFFKLIFNHLSGDGIILTYSNAAPVRNALLQAGFYVGKIFNSYENRFTGTIASKNKSAIKYELSEFDLGLLKTKAGILYRDENLTGLNEAIIKRRNWEVQNSNLLSCSKFKSKFHENSDI